MKESENLDAEFAQDGTPKRKVPSSTTALICGILSIPLAGLFGIILGIVAISFATTAIKKYDENPDDYLMSSLKNAKAGRVCGYIGIIGSIFWIAYAFTNFLS